MSDWYWRIIAFKAAFVLTCLASYLRADDSVPKLPFCNPHTIDDASNSNDLLIVSTLDGKLTAFSTEKGLKAWHLDTQPLLSSNLHHVELTSGGKWVRLVPSLRGGLYSLSGDTIEPLPFDAEQLLSASFKYSEDMVIAGARETHWLGVDARTGGIIYECGTAGCSGEQATAGAGRDVLVLRRQASTVRALDPRTGSEKWNFSVAEHQLALSRRECAGGVGGAEGAGAARVAIGVALPEGVVAVRRPGEGGNLWQYKLDAPVTNMWRLSDGSLQNVDVLWEATQSLTDRGSQLSPPSIYIGVHDTQLYIQEGLQYAEKLDTAVTTSSVPWKLLHTRPLLTSDTAVGNVDSLSLVTLYGGSGQTGNHGFFLYLQETCDQAVQVTEDIIDANETPTELPNDHHHVHIHVYSLWFWWKEVLLIAISSALLMNLMIWPRFFAPRLRTSTPLPITNETVIEEKHYEYSGRYENDFTPVRCLGRGGFGVVFEARNNIDHRSYAVKRITLPKKESKRERVLREVRALAKLEHEHIVRYFNAWLEVPPPLWQQQRDAIWCRELENMSVISDEYTATSPAPVSPRPEARKPGCVLLNLQSPDDALDNIRRMSEPSRHRSLSCNDSFSVVFDENANTDSKTLSQISSKKSMSKTSEPPNMLTKTNDDSFIVFANNSKTSNSGIDKLSKNMASGDNDSFIVFANTEDLSKGLSEARKETSVNKQLERVRQCDGFADSSVSKKKKKGHTRHWSLDLCVKSTTERAPIANEPKMYLYIQMQLCMKDSLHDWLRQNRCAESRGDKIKTLFSQIVSAVEYVHLAGLIHRDLKPSNIFFAPDGRVKVGDFGLVTAMNDNSQDGDSPTEIDAHAKHTFKVGTHLYMSPEQLLCRSYSYKVDIYSLGVILFELLQPFGSESERVASLMRLRSGHYPGDFGEKCPNEMEALKLMLSEEPSLRPTAMGVRARAPLWQDTDKRWHFTLPSVDRDVQLDCGNC